MLQITKGKTTGAIRGVIYGVEGIGKSTLASKIPGALFLDVEGGADQIGVDRLRNLDWRAIEGAIRDLTTDAQGYSAVVIDTADWCEKALLENMLRRTGKNSIEDYGYGKGYTMLQEEFSRFLTSLDKLIAKGIHVFFVAHSTVKRLSPPDQTDGYDHYEMKLTKQVMPLLKEWGDLVLFCKFKVQIVEGSDGRLKAQGGKDRIIYTTHSPAWDAKNRFGLPDEMPMEFASIAHLFGAATQTAAAAPVAKEAAPVTPKSATDAQIAKIQALNKAGGNATTIIAATMENEGAAVLDELPEAVAASLIASIEATPTAPEQQSEPSAVPPKIAAWLDANAAAVNAYLVRVSWVSAGQTWRNLSEEKTASLLSKTDKFARAANIPLPA